MSQPVQLDGQSLTVADVAAVAGGAGCAIAPEALRHTERQRERLERLLAAGVPVYGINTGVGQMVNFALDAARLREFQLNLIRSHCAGGGPAFGRREARAIVAARANALASGYSAVRPVLLERLVAYLNADVVPVIPQQGSLGASGDLAPLAHLALAVVGEGWVLGPDDRPRETAAVLRERGIGPFAPDAKEGLSLINGTSAMTGTGALLVADARAQVRQAEVVAAVSLQVLRASVAPFARCGHDDARPFPGQIATAANLRRLLAGSALVVEHADLADQLTDERGRQDPLRGTGVFLQKAYSLRACPQILGTVRDAVAHAQRTVELELNSASDNPLLIGDEVFHGANFHGQPLASVFDYLWLSLMQVGILSERRLNRLLHPALNGGLPPFLAAGDVGQACGLAGAQYLATALVAENRTIAPASTQSVPSNGDNQDVVSMGLIAARNGRRVWEHNSTILAVELLAAVHAVDLGGTRDRLSPAAAAAYRAVRERVPPLTTDRPPAPDIAAVGELVRSGELSAAAEGTLGAPLL